MRRGFTLIELVFVIVIIGIISKFGVELLYKSYEAYVVSNTFNRFTNESELAVKQIANRLSYRIKDTVIARTAPGAAVVPIGSITGNENVLEWMGIDSDGWRSSSPTWSGLIDLSPVSVGGLATSTINGLSSPGTTTNDSGAIFFIGAPVDLSTNFGYDGAAVTTQNEAIHPVNMGAVITSSNADDFDDIDVYEFYQFTKSAFAVSLDTANPIVTNGMISYKLIFYYDYKPWDGESMAAGKSTVLMENVKSFDFATIGDILIVQVCLTDNNAAGLGEYSLCKEKVIF